MDPSSLTCVKWPRCRKWFGHWVQKKRQFESDISTTNHPIPVLHLSVSCLRKRWSGAILWLLSGNFWSLIHSYLGAGINVMEGRRKLIQVHCIACYVFWSFIKTLFLIFFLLWRSRDGRKLSFQNWSALAGEQMEKVTVSPYAGAAAPLHLSWILDVALN